MAELRLPRVLEPVVRNGLTHQVTGSTLAEALGQLFDREPALRAHLLDERGSIRHHVVVFVDGTRVGLEATIEAASEIRVLQAVSGG
jgi:molybdopterin synthase sulfur carrier subunit